MGHFGFVRLALPVFHVGFYTHTYTIMQCICKACGRLLMEPEHRDRFLNRLRRPTTDDFTRASLQKKVVELCKKVRRCPHCQFYNAVLRKGTGIPLIMKHQIGPSWKATPEDVRRGFEDSFQDAVVGNPQIGAYIEKTNQDVNPLVAFNLLRLMTPQDRELLGIVKPERLLVTAVPVPPLCVRPTVSMGDSGVAEDDLTHVVSEIIEANITLKKHLQDGSPSRNVLEAWYFLQEKCAIYVNAEASGLHLPAGRAHKTLCTRLKGKQGRFRGNLSGKRVNFSGRTVISPDPNVSVEQVVVPTWVAKRMTYPERVCNANMARLQDAIRKGPEEWPGSTFVRFTDGRGKYLGALRKNHRDQVAESVVPGDLVERHMIDGDVVLFNRQPSLHRLSIMAHKAKVMPGRTFRFNECVCAPYNADFDGDEMNLHLPQTEEARAEAQQLMGVRDGLVTPKSGEVAICATQDFLTAAFLLTQKNVFLTRDKFCQLCCSITDGIEQIDLPPPAILKPCELWTGKQAFSMLLRPNKQSKVFVNLEVPEKNYSKKGESMCVNDGWVILRNSELVSGNLGKKILGGAKNGLFFRLIRDNSAEAAIACMSRLAKMTSRWLMNRGFTIGIDDVTATLSVRNQKSGITRGKYDVVDEKIKQFHAGTLPLKPGCNAEQTLEAVVNGELGQIRDMIGGMCEQQLTFMNKPRIMAQCGSKGSAINLCQMMACCGQQNVGGQRIKDGFVNRTLPHFAKGSKAPKARGFVQNSFYTGLEPTEFFFHTMGGREGLVDTAVKTAETGYMARRLMKALEDLSVKYDLTVRTSAGEVVQFVFGDDGLDPARMEGSYSKPLDFQYVMEHVQYVMRPPRIFESEQNRVQRRWGSSGEASASKRRCLGTDVAPEGPELSLGAAALALSPMAPRSSWTNDARAIARSPEPKDLGYRSCPLLPLELTELAKPCAERFGACVRRTHGSAELDLTHIEGDLEAYLKSLAEHVADKREHVGLVRGDTAESAAAARKHLKLAGQEAFNECIALVDLGLCPTQMQLEAFVNRCAQKYVQAMLMPGEAVGAVAAQSIGEPATQMTLKTFHFAGVASMNVTLGVPRIKEIINAAKQISTPIITCSLLDESSEVSARIVKGRIERTTLGDICRYYKEVYDPMLGCFISVKIDLGHIRKLQLELTVENIKEALLDHKIVGGIRLSVADVQIVGRDKLRVLPPQRNAHGHALKMLYFHLQSLKNALPNAVVKGFKDTVRAVVNKEEVKKKETKAKEVKKDAAEEEERREKKRKTEVKETDEKEKQDKEASAEPARGTCQDDKGTRYSLLVEGYGLRDVMITPGIEAHKTKSNHVIEVEKVLGIEAARRTIMSEVAYTMGQHGIAIDARHIQMLGDCMTYRGQVLGINRYGISRMRASALMLASFERTNDHIFDAAVHNRSDPVTGVSECIILGSTINLGTGLFKLLYDSGGRHPPQSLQSGSASAMPLVGASRTPLLSNWKKARKV